MADLPVPGDNRRVAGMFGRVAGSYDLLNHVLSAGLDIAWRRTMVRTLLAPGGSVDPMETYRRFRGRDPQLQPLLDRLGLSL